MSRDLMDTLPHMKKGGNCSNESGNLPNISKLGLGLTARRDVGGMMEVGGSSDELCSTGSSLTWAVGRSGNCIADETSRALESIPRAVRILP